MKGIMMGNKNSPMDMPARPKLDWQSFEEMFRSLELPAGPDELTEFFGPFAAKEALDKLAGAVKELNQLHPRLMGEQGLAQDCGRLAAELDRDLGRAAGQLSQAAALEKEPAEQRAAEISRLMGGPDGARAILDNLEKKIKSLEASAVALGKELEGAANRFRQLDAANQANRALGSWGVEMKEMDEALGRAAKALSRALLPSKKDKLRKEIQELEARKSFLDNSIGKARKFTAFYERISQLLWANGPVFIGLEKTLVQLGQGFHAPRLAVESLLAGDTVAFPAEALAKGLADLKQTRLQALDYFRGGSESA